MFGRSPETFVFLRADRSAIVWFALIVAAVPPLALLAVEEIARVAQRDAPRVVHFVLVALLASSVAVQVVKRVVGWRGVIALGVALLLGGLAAVARQRVAPVRAWLMYASPAPVLFAVMFLATSPVSALLGGGSGADGGAGVATGGNGAPVVVLLLDELPLATLLGPDGALDTEQFPGFARLAESSTWYRNATSVQGETTRAVPAMLTGLYPTRGDVAGVWTEYEDNLFTWLGGGYEMNVLESLTGLCPPSICDEDVAAGPESRGLGAVLGEARRVWGELVGPSVASADLTAFAEQAPTESLAHDGEEARQPARVALFLQRLGQIPHDRSLSFLHIVLPHVPFVYLPSGTTYEAPDVLTGMTPEAHWSRDEWTALLGRQRHLLQARYVDALVDDVLDRLEKTGLADDAWFVVTADHGASFTAGESFRFAADGNFAEIMWVPFFVRPPGGNGGEVSEANVETIDLLPTVADAIGVEVPWETDGRSALGEPRAGDDKHYQRFERGGYETAPDERLTYDAAEGQELLAQMVYPSDRRGDPSWWPYQIGAHPELVGTPADDLAPGEPAGEVTLDTPFPPEIAQGATVLPAWVSGHVDIDPEAAGADGGEVALAVDGVVAAVVPFIGDAGDDGDATEFAAMLPEPLLTPGPHTLDVFLLDDSAPGAPVLHPLARR